MVTATKMEDPALDGNSELATKTEDPAAESLKLLNQ